MQPLAFTPPLVKSVPNNGHTRELARVGQGVPFEVEQARQMSQVLGFPVSREGLTKLYESCLEGSHCYITDVHCEQGRVDYAVSWRDHEGEELARAETHVARHPDGSLELHRSGVYVAHQCRGQGVSIKILEQEISLVRKGSKHTDSRVTLEAGGMSVNGVSERLGTYTWARYGFDFADNYPQGRSKLLTYDSYYGTEPAASRMQAHFRAWANNHTEPPLTQELHKLSRTIQHPWEMASLKLNGHQFPVEVGGEVSRCHIGKAFMLSEFCENYGAVFRVNDPKFAGAPVARQAFTEQLQSAQARLCQEKSQLEQELQTAPERALARLRLRGGSEWIPKLEALLQKRQDLKVQIQETMDGICGALLLRGLRNQVRNHWTESTQAVLREHKERMNEGWPGSLCRVSDRPALYKFKIKLRQWVSRWHLTKN
ncbi:hypothetical protein JST97_25460 [bacterium]|nr:hypothetical protein [bacterium]